MNLLDLVQQKGLVLRRVSSHKGGEYHGPCPGCGGNDRFHVWPEQDERGTYWCRQCGKAGDAIQFLRDFDGMGYRQACAALGLDAKEASPVVSTTPTIPKRSRNWQPEKAADPGETWQAQAEKLIAWAQGNLLENPAALAYLEKRGVSLETIKDHRLGWITRDQNNRDLFRPRQSWGLPEELREDGKPKRLWLPRGLLIPQRSNGVVTRIRVRRPAEDRSEYLENIKYYVLPGSGRAPLYLNRNRPAVVIVEAELDALLINQVAGDLVASYAIGNSTAKPDADSAEYLRQAACLLLCLDFDQVDDQGRRPGTEAVKWWLQNFSTARRWPVPEGKDPGDAFKAGTDLRLWVLAGLPPGLRPRPERPQPSGIEERTDPSWSQVAPASREGNQVVHGTSKNGKQYVITDQPGDHGCAAFSWSEINQLRGMDPEQAEIFITLKEQFGNDAKVLNTKKTGPSLNARREAAKKQKEFNDGQR